MLKFLFNTRKGSLKEGSNFFKMEEIILEEIKHNEPNKNKGGNNTHTKSNEKEEVMICQIGMKHNYNAHLTDELEKVFRAYEVIKDEREGKGLLYGKLIGQIKVFPRKITTVNDIKQLPNIGPALSQQLEEILLTGKLRKAESLMVYKE